MDLRTSLQQGMSQHKLEGYELKEDGILMYRRGFYVPNDQELKSMLLSKMHKVPYARHPCYQKTIFIVKKQHYWPRKKKDITNFIARCLQCQKVKVEHIHQVGLLQLLPIPEWNWEVVTMDFITKLPRIAKKHDSIMAIVDKLTKSSHFIPMKSAHKETNIDEIYMR